MISDELRIILIFLTAYFGAVFVLPKLSHIAVRIGLLDQPNARKVHTKPRPLVGGIGMVIAATVSSLVFIPFTGLRGYFLGLAILLLIGFFDDYKEVGHRLKFLAQIVAVIVMIYFSKISLLSLGNLLGLGEIVLPGGAIVIWLFTIFAVVGVVNSINLIDGLDGLAGGLSFIAFLFFAVHASLAVESTLLYLNMALAGAILGFLRFNWHPSVLFMGDAGSLCLGFSLAFMALALTQGDNAVIRPVTALLVLAVPIVDTLVIMSKRIMKGSSPFVADKYHLHHIFMRYGMGRDGAVRAILSLSFFMGCVSLLDPIYHFPEYLLFLIFIVYFIIYIIASFFIIDLLRYSFRFRRSKPRSGAADSLLKLIFGGVDFYRVFRKAPRHEVSFELKCFNHAGNELFRGKVLDISNTGCMSSIKELDVLYEEMILAVTIPTSGGSLVLRQRAEHIWVSQKNGKYFQGFKFKEVDDDLEQALLGFLERSGKKGRGN